jgi:hypothetical protein
MAVVDDLLANAGSYIGRGWFAPAERPPRVCRLVIAPLPGLSGVAFDYDVISLEGELKHREHSMLARSSDDATILVVGYHGSPTVALLHEIEPGFFAERQQEAYRPGQMGVKIQVPESGRVRHAYCWAADDGQFAEMDVADLRAVT